jgi:hypothetical protein
MKTSKLITALSISGLIFFSFISSAQSSNTVISDQSTTEGFGKGSNVIGIGLGLGGNYTDIYSGYSSTPNFVLTYDNGTFGNVGPGIISLGGLFSYKGVSYTGYDGAGYPYDDSWHYYIIGFRAAYHWDFTSNPHFDPYAGLMLAYYDISASTSFNDPYYNGIGNPYNATYASYTALSLYIGARYFVSNKIGIWLELGFGYSNAALGVSFKF